MSGSRQGEAIVKNTSFVSLRGMLTSAFFDLAAHKLVTQVPPIQNIADQLPNVFVLAAATPLGRAVVRHYAGCGARVIAVDQDTVALHEISSEYPALIEPLTVPQCQPQVFECLEEVWADHPIDLVVNLLPLTAPDQSEAQMTWLGVAFRSLLRGLAKGRGSLVSVALRPSKPLALNRLATHAALRESSFALGRAVADAHVRVHSVSVPQDAPLRALSTVIYLGTSDGAQLRSTAFELD